MSDAVVTNVEVEAETVKRPSRKALTEYLKLVGPKLGLPAVEVTSREGGQIAIMVATDGGYRNLFPSVGLRKAAEWMDILGAVNDVYEQRQSK